MKRLSKTRLILALIAILTCVALGAYATTQISLDAPATLPSDI